MQPFDANVEIDDFRIIRRIGAGGMGVVYLAEQVSLGRPVALKVLGKSLTHPSDIVRFKREAQAAARLQHPGIATIYKTAQDEHACYMAMEYIDGATLRSVLLRLAAADSSEFAIKTLLHEVTQLEFAAPRMRFDDLTEQDAQTLQQKLAERQSPIHELTPEAERIIGSKQYMRWVCEIIREVALALDHAHRHGVIHRDIKPQNIMIDREGKTHVIDFGVAKYFEDHSLTETGQLVGTAMYMSPEQVAERIHVDQRSDIYSLGLVMYELLTLRRPWMISGREALLRGVLTKSMIPASWKNQSLPRPIENVVHMALAKDPDERYQSGRDFADDLARVLAGESVVAEPYRYKFDNREIVAARPLAATASALWFYYVAVFFVLTWLPFKFGMKTVNPKSTTHWGMIATAVECVVMSLGALVAGVSLLGGRAWARWLGVPVAIAAVGLSLQQLFEVLHAAWMNRMPSYLAVMSIWLATRTVLVLGGCAVIVALVLFESTRHWLRFCAQVRAEHDLFRNSRTTQTRPPMVRVEERDEFPTPRTQDGPSGATQ